MVGGGGWWVVLLLVVSSRESKLSQLAVWPRIGSAGTSQPERSPANCSWPDPAQQTRQLGNPLSANSRIR